MPEPLQQRVARPSSEAESPGVSTPRGVNRNHLTLYISFAAIILSCASAAVNLFTFYGGGQQKMLNEADQIMLKAQANRVLHEVNIDPNSHPALQAELQKLYKNLQYHPASDASLSLYERAAFSAAVEAYALPLSSLQLQRIQAIQAGKETMSIDEFHSRKLQGCYVDPYEDGCPIQLSSMEGRSIWEHPESGKK